MRALLPAALLCLLTACPTPPPKGTPDDAGSRPDAGHPDAGVPDAGLPGTRLRLVAGNISSGNKQSYDPGEGIDILKGLHPDVAMLQELNYGDGGEDSLRALVDAACGSDCSVYREPRGGSVDIPNGIVSRYPILDAGYWQDTEVNNRHFVWAQIDIPGPVDLYAVSVHLLTSSAGERDLQAHEIVSDINSNFPAGAYVVVGGDFNTDSRAESCISTLAPVLVTTRTPPADQNGNANTNAPRSKPYDWVLTNSALDALVVSTDLGASRYPNGLVFDSRVYTPLSDVSPVVASDSAAVNMQHMAVVRDFLIPDAGR